MSLPMTSQPAQSPVASSSTLWAQASKEWVIPAKPKPGRKPKKDSPPSNEIKETDSKGRRVQNRAAQRAFRERKQSQLAELQARVQSYEQGEIERNVALQQIAKRLKEENEQLKTENSELKEEITRLKEHAATTSVASSSLPVHDKSDRSKSQKRWREDVAQSNANNDNSIILEPAVRKRFRPGTESPRQSMTPIPQYGHTNAYAPSSPSIASSPDSNDASRSPFSPLSFVPLPPASGPNQASTSYSMSNMFSGPSGDALKSFDALGGSPAYDTFDCGLCTENTPCVCRELAMQSVASLSGISASLSGFTGDYLVGQDRPTALKVEDTETRVVGSISNVIEIPPASDTSNNSGKSSPPETTASSYTTSVRPDTLSERGMSSNSPYQIRLPSPEPAPTSSVVATSRSVPLRLKNRRRSASGKVWQISPAGPICSGDPSNCPACKDDDFGKAFCRALGDSASTTAPACASCPNPEACGKAPRATDIPSNIASSSNRRPEVIELPSAGPEQGSSISRRPSGTIPSVSNTGASISSTPSSDGKLAGSSETIPANEAWARLKSHPNIAFADLSMLADVVARRTKCSGPVAVIHPAPGSITPERDVARSPAVPESEATRPTETPGKKDGNGNTVHLTDPHAHFRAQEQQRAQISSGVPSGEQNCSSVLPGSRPSTLSLGPGAAERPSLVPQEELRECGRRRIREVDAAGVREALRILDAQFDKHS